jgi:hypothetical protein
LYDKNPLTFGNGLDVFDSHRYQNGQSEQQGQQPNGGDDDLRYALGGSGSAARENLIKMFVTQMLGNMEPIRFTKNKENNEKFKKFFHFILANNAVPLRSKIISYILIELLLFQNQLHVC